MDGAERVTRPENGATPLKICITVEDQEVVVELRRHLDGLARAEYALAALKIGVLTLKQAQGRIDSELVTQATNRLGETMANTLREYFDPRDGKFSERVNRLMQEDGELEQFMRRQIGAEDSELTRTLEAFVGERSPFMQLLSTDDSEGFLKSLADAVEEKLCDQRKRLLEEFSLDREDSALSRLVAHVRKSQSEITGEFSLDDDASALSRMRQALLAVLEKERRENEDFRAKVVEKLAAIVTRRDTAQRSTIRGADFETAVCEFIQTESQKAGDVAVPTGTIVGSVKNCKVGDCVVELGNDSRAAGARIVVEAKEKDGYTLEEALTEIEKGRKNRGAEVGVFVFSRKTAPSKLAPMQRQGDDVFVVWDAEDVSSDTYLLGGLSVARALCTRAQVQRESAEMDFRALDSTIANIEKQIGWLSEIKTFSETIETNSGKILKRVAIMQEQLGQLLGDLRDEVSGIKSHVLTGSGE